MTFRNPRWLLLAVLTAVLALTRGTASAQPPPVAPPDQSAAGGVILGTPQPVGPDAQGGMPLGASPPPPAPPPPPPGLPPTPFPPAPPPSPVSPLAPLAPGPAPVPVGPPPPPAPLFLQPGQLPPGAFVTDGHFFASLQVDAVSPDISNRLQAPVTNLAMNTSVLMVPDVKLGWTISPRIDMGLRLPDNGSEFALGYRFLITDGTGIVNSLNGPLYVKSRLDINQFDLYYGSPTCPLTPWFDFKWRAGIRAAIVFFDTQAANPAIDTHASNYFVGAGPEGGMEIGWKLPFVPAFSLFARGDGAILVGQIDQKYSIMNPSVPVSPINGGTEVRVYQSVPVLGVQGGLHFVPPGTTMKFSAGYSLERWWSLGHANDARLDLTTQSVFIRGEIQF